MKFVVERAPLAAALTRAAKIVKRSNPGAPILNNVRLDAVKDMVTLTASNVDSSFEIEMPAMVKDANAITVPLASLSGFISGVPDGAQVECEVTGDDDRMVVRAGRGRAKLATLPAAEYPERADLIEPTRFMLPGGELAKALGRIAHAMCNEETRYYLCGVHMHVDPENPRRLSFVATDGHRLGLAHVDRPDDLPEFTPPILPRNAVHELIALATNADVVDLEITAHQVRAIVPGVTYTTKLIDGTYPKYRHLIPTEGEFSFETARAELLAAARRAAVIIDTGKDGRILKLVQSKGLLEMRGEGTYGEIHDETEAKTEGEATVNFNVAFTADALGAFSGGPVHCHFTPLVSMVFSEPGDETHLQLVMTYNGRSG